MHSPLAFLSKIIIFFNCLFYLVIGQNSRSIHIKLIEPSLQHSLNPLSVLSSRVCPIPSPGGLSVHQKPKYHPWDIEPKCLQIASPNGERTYCIHSSTSFSNGRGISILSTPEIGSSIASSSAFQASILTPNTETSSLSKAPPSFEVKEIPGRGKGLVANKTINFGEVISYNTPLLIVDRKFFDSEGGLEKEQRFTLLREAVSKLPVSSQKLFYEQCTRESGIEPVSGKRNPEAEIEDIMKTNSYTGYFTSLFPDKTKTEDPVTHGANIPESSRLNHDCRPNTHFLFDTQTLTHKIHAIKTINPGEEITTSYISELDSYEIRQSKLHKHWGFQCSCSHCSVPEAQNLKSNARLTLISKYRTYLLDWTPDSVGTPSLSEKYISLLKQEKLYSKLGEAYVIAALRFNAWEKEEEAKRYAEMAVKSSLWWDEDERVEMEEMERLKVEGRRHWSWGLGRKLRIGVDGTEPVEMHHAHAGMRLVKQEVIR